MNRSEARIDTRRQYWLHDDGALPIFASREWPGKYAHQYVHVREVRASDPTTEEIIDFIEGMIQGNFFQMGKEYLAKDAIAKCGLLQRLRAMLPEGQQRGESEQT